MPLFACPSCGCVENTALGEYWGEDEPKCSECSTGTWHGKFPKKNAKEAGYYTDGQFIYGPDEVDTEKMVWKYNNNFKIVGPVQ